MKNAGGAVRVWERLVRGESLDDLALPVRNGRIVVRDLTLPKPSRGRGAVAGFEGVAELRGTTVLRNVRWKGLDFAECSLSGLRFVDCRLEDCCFERALCRGWRMWNTTVKRTEFREADLHGAALGGVDAGKRNRFENVYFVRSDMRETAWVSCDMIGCVFEETRLDKVDFQGTRFEHCSFVGEVREVLFYRHAFGEEQLPANDMRGVDFSRARLRSVEFRGLDLKEVKWPTNDDQLVIPEYVQALDRALRMLAGRAEPGAKNARVLLEMQRRWAGPAQWEGIVSRRELVAAAGRKLAEELIGVLRQRD